MDSAGLAVGGTLAYLGSSYLQLSPLYLEGQQIWAEWAAWGIIALACRIRSHCASRTPTPSLVDEEKNTPTSPRWSKVRSIDTGATLVAFLFVTAQCIALRAQEEQLQWAFVSTQCPLCPKTLTYLACRYSFHLPHHYSWPVDTLAIL